MSIPRVWRWLRKMDADSAAAHSVAAAVAAAAVARPEPDVKT